MRHVLYVIIWFGLFVSVFGEPKAVCSGSVYDFGEKSDTETIEHVFTLRNAGDQPLEIQDLRVSCGCTIGLISEKMILPGGESKVHASFRLKGRRGPQRQSLHVRTSDPVQSEILLTLIGRVRADVALIPPMIFFGRLNSRSEITQFADLEIYSNQLIRVLNVSCPAEWVEASFDSDFGRAGRIRIRTRPPLPEGLVHTVVDIQTDSETLPLLRLPVGAYVRPEIEAKTHEAGR